MSWAHAKEYKALIGGILYRNVPQPILCNGECPLSFTRNTETNKLAVSIDLEEQDGPPIASILNNVITLHNTVDYLIRRGLDREAVVHKQTGRIWCDLKYTPGNANYELEVSCLLFSKSGFPMCLHPNRSKFGTANNNEPPNISGMTLTTDFGSGSTSIAVENNQFYLLEVAIENFNTGIQITHSQKK